MRRAERELTLIDVLDNTSAAASKADISRVSASNARTTRAPERFSFVSLVTSSSFSCTRLYPGIVSAMISHKAPPITSAETTKISEIFRSIIIAITIAPTDMKGARKIRRMNIATACCA